MTVSVICQTKTGERKKRRETERKTLSSVTSNVNYDDLSGENNFSDLALSCTHNFGENVLVCNASSTCKWLKNLPRHTILKSLSEYVALHNGFCGKMSCNRRIIISCKSVGCHVHACIRQRGWWSTNTRWLRRDIFTILWWSATSWT